MYDIIVVGARCAGSPLAMLLSRKGYRVLLVDKARFPSDTLSTHVLWQAGLARAKRWGLLETLLALGAPPIRTLRFNTGEGEFAGCPPPLDGVEYAIAPRRTVLDKALVDAAVQAGAELREGFLVREIVFRDGRVTGIRGSSSGGRLVTEEARLVVGADGAHSLVAHAVQAEKYNTRPSTAPGWYTYWRNGPKVTDFEMYVLHGVAGCLIPTNDGLVCIVGGWTSAFIDPKETPENAYRAFLRHTPRMREFLDGAEQVAPLLGTPDLPGFFRKPYGHGWALAGDAGYHKHPLSAQGITDAFRDADMLSEAIDDGLSGRCDLTEALAAYERQRNEAVMPMYESTCMRALLEPFPPEVVALFRALENNPYEAGRFFGTDAGTVPMAEFFAPDNLERIIRGSAAAGAAG